jgi:glyoxylase-like metal-dependent hydrolase (beta-lactamase superfamily II)
MTGEIITIRDDVLMCRGGNPDSVIFDSIISNCYVVRQDDTVFLIDTGAGPELRKSILEAVDRLKEGAENFVLVNTHMHVDHVANNDIIKEIQGFRTVKHFVHDAGRSGFNTYDYLFNNFKMADRYYDVFEGPPPPWRTLIRFMKIGNRDKALHRLVKWGFKKFEPVNFSQETMTYLTDEESENLELGTVTIESLKVGDDVVSIDLGALKVRGWSKYGAVFINDGAHSPEHLLVYFPDKKIIFTGDMTLEMFPMWTGESSGEKNMESLLLCLEMSEEGLVKVLADSHHQEYFEGRPQINEFLRRLIANYRQFKKTVLSLLHTGEKYTVYDIYRGLRKMRFDDNLVNYFIENQFPKSPVFLKTIITNILLEEGCTVEGQGKDTTFSLS